MVLIFAKAGASLAPSPLSHAYPSANMGLTRVHAISYNCPDAMFLSCHASDRTFEKLDKPPYDYYKRQLEIQDVIHSLLSQIFTHLFYFY